MLKTPSIAVLTAEDREIPVIEALWRRHEYQVSQCNSIHDLIGMAINGNLQNIDVVVLPLFLSQNGSGINVALQMRSDARLATIPILGLSSSRDKSTLNSFYGAGADVVVVSPFDADLVYFQVCAMMRQRLTFEETIIAVRGNSAGADSSLMALDACPDALVVLSPEYQAVFLNQSARILLGSEGSLDAAQQIQLGQQFRSLIVIHEHARSNAHSPASNTFISPHEGTLNRFNGQTFKASMRFITLSESNSSPLGWVVSLADSAVVEQLTQSLLQAQRVQSLALLCAAAGIRALDQAFGKIPLEPLSRLISLNQAEPKRVVLSIAMSTLVEILDGAFSPGISIKVQDADVVLAVKPSDLYQILGQMLFHAVAITRGHGEINLRTIVEQTPSFAESHTKNPLEAQKSNGFEQGCVTIVIDSQTAREPFLVGDAQLQTVLRGDLSLAVKNEEAINPEASKIEFGLSRAQDVAVLYGSKVEFQKRGDSAVRIRIKLPLG